MSEIEAEVKRWGNSMGVRLPRDFLKGEGIAEGDRIHLHVEKSVSASKDHFGVLKRLGVVPRVSYEGFKAAEKRKDRSRDRRTGLR